MERKERIRHYIELVSKGTPLEAVRAQFRREFAGVSADEIVDAERRLVAEGMEVSEVQRLCDVHAALFEGAVDSGDASGEPAGHPLFIFARENDGLSAFLRERLAPAYQAWERDADAGREALLDALRGLAKVDKHYSRKENLFFPYLEKAGVTAPPKVMWGVDDEIRALIRELTALVSEGDRTETPSRYARLMDQVRGMITKEQEILLPLLHRHLNEEDFRTIALESDQIGFAFANGVEGASPSDAKAFARTGSAEPEARPEGVINLPSGYFTGPELTALLNTLPCDVTFVGADDTVHFFSEQPSRVFPRTRTIIGRRVADCHPPKSLPVVEALIGAFKDGSKDSEAFWIQRGEQFILIRYYAVRDGQGKYLGVLECTEEISALRQLEGSKLLMG